MRSMTKQQAELFIRAGYFPKEDDIDDIVDLQDVFGHQDVWSIYKWLYDSSTKENAKKLFYLIWNKEDVDRYINYVANIYEEEKKLAEIRSKIATLNYEEKKLSKIVCDNRRKMYNNE